MASAQYTIFPGASTGAITNVVRAASETGVSTVPEAERPSALTVTPIGTSLTEVRSLAHSSLSSV